VYSCLSAATRDDQSEHEVSSCEREKEIQGEKAATIRSLCGKYKHLDLMNALMKSRAQERQSNVEVHALDS